MQLNEFSYDVARLELMELIYSAVLDNFTIPSDLIPEQLKLDIFRTLEQPPEQKLGDYAFPCFKLAKALKSNPNELATKIKSAIEAKNSQWISHLELKGAFLNTFINQQTLAKNFIPTILSGDNFSAFTVNSPKNAIRTMIEFSQPNTHKEFHVGHGRNVCLGDSLCRLYSYAGYQVVPVNYIGDEGTHIAKCLWGIKNYQGAETLSEKTPNKAEWLGQRYVEANNALKDASDEDKQKIQAEISLILKKLESKSGEEYELWKTTRQYCLDDFNSIYSWLDVHFDHFFYESEVSEASQEIVEEYMKKGLFVEDNGAVGFDMSDKKLGFFMARKSDGTTLYITKDLALAKVKFNQFNIQKSIYVVGSEQNFHFKQLFYALEKMGFEAAKDCYHLSYGMVVRPEGKMSSRSGNSFTFLQLIKIVQDEIQTYLDKYKNEWSDERILDTAHKLAVGAIKYGMLIADPNKEIVFDPKEWVSFEGNSGPYLMYSYARTQSILTKSQEQGYHSSTDHLGSLTHESERELLRALYDFNKTALYAAENYKPSTLAHHLFGMCKSFNRFYVEVSVLKAENDQVRSARIALIESFALTLKTGLHLLGITPPDKM
ncbi:MAG: arginine--tRNA ligase [Bacteriovoracaceae bacterium]|jgi:arginyl-tRNA synthetase|nr:arginine--tRNA ligase [Bacteriovoracaceae bacterium]